jgi:hypothetical protein
LLAAWLLSATALRRYKSGPVSNNDSSDVELKEVKNPDFSASLECSCPEFSCGAFSSIDLTALNK